jgi:hypothetical protein
MKKVSECDLNWLQDSDALGALAQCRQAEIRQDKSAVSLRRPAHASRNAQFTWQRALAFASAITVIVGIVVMH